MECLVAFALLLPLIALIGQMGFQTERANRESILVSGLHRELLNAREVVGSWSFDAVTEERIESIPFAMNKIKAGNGKLAASNLVPEYSKQWTASVLQVREPIDAKRISLLLKSTPVRSGFPSEVGPLTFWVFLP
jgi:hypothetical protein